MLHKVSESSVMHTHIHSTLDVRSHTILHCRCGFLNSSYILKSCCLWLSSVVCDQAVFQWQYTHTSHLFRSQSLSPSAFLSTLFCCVVITHYCYLCYIRCCKVHDMMVWYRDNTNPGRKQSMPLLLSRMTLNCSELDVLETESLLLKILTVLPVGWGLLRIWYAGRRLWRSYMLVLENEM